MSYHYVNSVWCIYREDMCPKLSHIYHIGCSTNVSTNGEYCCVYMKTMICECGRKVSLRAITLWKRICKGYDPF